VKGERRVVELPEPVGDDRRLRAGTSLPLVAVSQGNDRQHGSVLSCRTAVTAEESKAADEHPDVRYPAHASRSTSRPPEVSPGHEVAFAGVAESGCSHNVRQERSAERCDATHANT